MAEMYKCRRCGRSFISVTRFNVHVCHTQTGFTDPNQPVAFQTVVVDEATYVSTPEPTSAGGGGSGGAGSD